jgi:hypothetical protein
MSGRTDFYKTSGEFSVTVSSPSRRWRAMRCSSLMQRELCKLPLCSWQLSSRTCKDEQPDQCSALLQLHQAQIAMPTQLMPGSTPHLMRDHSQAAGGSVACVVLDMLTQRIISYGVPTLPTPSSPWHTSTYSLLQGTRMHLQLLRQPLHPQARRGSVRLDLHEMKYQQPTQPAARGL